MSILQKGGNAYDASVAALLVLNVTNGVHSSFPCEAPVMIYNAADGSVHSYIGAGKAPAAATLESFLAKGWKTIPSTNIWAQLVPASPDVMIALLKDYGTMSFAEVAAPAIQIARKGSRPPGFCWWIWENSRPLADSCTRWSGPPTGIISSSMSGGVLCEWVTVPCIRTWPIPCRAWRMWNPGNLCGWFPFGGSPGGPGLLL